MTTTLNSTYLTATIGQDETTYQPVSVTLDGNLLIAGRTGSGVSNTVNNVIADVAGKPFTELLGIDPFNQLSNWANRFSAIAATATDISALLLSVEQRLGLRKHLLMTKGETRIGFDRGLEPTDDMPLIVLVVSDLGSLDAAATLRIGEILRSARYLGIYVVAATQGVIPSASDRANISTVIAHATPSAAVTRTLLMDAAEVAPAEELKVTGKADRGVGYAVTDTTVTKFRAPYLPADLVARIASATSSLIPQSLI